MNILILSSRPDISSAIAAQFQYDSARIFTVPSLSKSRPILRRTKIDCVIVTDWVADVMLEDFRHSLTEAIEYKPMLVHARSISNHGGGHCYCGLDDCIPTPGEVSARTAFSDIPPEVVARNIISTHSDWRKKRMPLKVNGYHFMPDCNRVDYNQTTIRLRQKEFDLAYLIFKFHTEVVTHDEILEFLWPNDKTKTLRNIVPHMSTIRRKLHLNADHGLVIRSIYGEGYRLEDSSEINLEEAVHLD
ncbi:winged helix-turn-helix domain-containing protein [Burkholderia paludis]|uniref:winged helix-turn-helix domain-containing protein n=1 Tax=Burkholderia paludis TaxID=1506587 RepID=UPI0013768845|nr:winged helix-turn-helix domain-containing protein [Burkholderia paludis]